MARTVRGPLLGSHLSIAGSMTNALREGEGLGLDTVQVFTKNQQQWKIKGLEPSAIAEWRAEVKRLGWGGRTVSHASYLINLASPDDELWAKSVDLMTVEVERCEQLGIPLLVHHPGAYTTSDAEAGMARIAKAYKELFKRTKSYTTVSCLEGTTGSGSNLGRTFEELARVRALILDAAAEPGRVGFCIDTCHAHAGGYDLSSRALGDAVLDELDRVCGLEHVRVLHVNDSAKAMGSRADRHAHIGEGTIGAPPGAGGTPRKVALRDTGFAAFLNRREFDGIPAIMETPKGQDPKGKPWDAMNLRRLRSMID